jgi:hypothetical protein
MRFKTTYQIRFMPDFRLDFSDFTALTQLGQWLHTTGRMWSCLSSLPYDEFKAEFRTITPLKSRSSVYF